jgi:F-type H+-transporting ATPase subunit b
MIELNESFLMQLANFFAMILFLNYFLFKPVMEIVDRRNKALKGLHTDAAKAANDAAKSMKEYDERAAEAKRATSAILISSRQAAAAEQETILRDARQRYAETVDAALVKIKADIKGAEAGLKGEAEKLSRDMATRLLGREAR